MLQLISTPTSFFSTKFHVKSSAVFESRRPPISEEHMRRLIECTKRYYACHPTGSKYAGGALPELARTCVRGLILTLPQRGRRKRVGQMVPVSGGSERDSR
jgi:transcriptional repressor OPI1